MVLDRCLGGEFEDFIVAPESTVNIALLTRMR